MTVIQILTTLLATATTLYYLPAMTSTRYVSFFQATLWAATLLAAVLSFIGFTGTWN